MLKGSTAAAALTLGALLRFGGHAAHLELLVATGGSPGDPLLVRTLPQPLPVLADAARALGAALDFAGPLLLAVPARPLRRTGPAAPPHPAPAAPAAP